MEIQNKYFIVYSNRLPTYKEFYKNVMKKNIACLFNSDLTNSWICRKEWIQNDFINFDFITHKYGSFLVPVYNCDEKFFNSNPKNEMKCTEYMKYWKDIINNDYKYNDSKPILYLKDWHLSQDSKDSSFYEIPIYFESDYLNEYCAYKKITDYKFTYMGPKCSSTPLHIDVFGSFSWSANVIGTKKWLMIPSCNVSKLKELVGTIPHDLYTVADHKEIIKQVEGFEIIQKTGEILFIPSGYMHQIINLEDTISINHNWFNACNIDSIYENLMSAYLDVKNEMIDLKNNKEWDEICNKIMTIHFGMNLNYFIEIIRYIANRLITESSKYEFKFQEDIISIKQIFFKILTNDDFSQIVTKQDWELLKQLKKYYR